MVAWRGLVWASVWHTVHTKVAKFDDTLWQSLHRAPPCGTENHVWLKPGAGIQPVVVGQSPHEVAHPAPPWRGVVRACKVCWGHTTHPTHRPRLNPSPPP